MLTSTNQERRLKLIDTLNEHKALRANLKFKLEQALMRVWHYEESLEAVDIVIKKIEQAKKDLDPKPKIRWPWK